MQRALSRLLMMNLIRRNRDTRGISLFQTARVFYGEDTVDKRRQFAVIRFCNVQAAT